jgi:Ca2+-binding EF-hand superfamily protein
MDADKDGMISKSEFVRMMEAQFDAMDKAKTGRLTPAQVQEVIDSIGKQFGYSN